MQNMLFGCLFVSHGMKTKSMYIHVLYNPNVPDPTHNVQTYFNTKTPAHETQYCACICLQMCTSKKRCMRFIHFVCFFAACALVYCSQLLIKLLVYQQ